MSLLTTASLVITPNAGEEGTLFSIVPDTGLGDMSVVRATTATRVNSAGLVELVPYNLVQYSQDFSNAYWTKIGATLVSGQADPFGGNNAFLFNDNSSSSFAYSPTGFVYSQATVSIYAKYSSDTSSMIYVDDSTGAKVLYFNPQNGTIISTPSGYTSSITDVGNGWYRVTLTGAIDGAVGFGTFGGGAVSTYFFGYQLVEGSVAKDYQKTETRLNIPRLDYSNGTCPSLLVEPQRTNLVTYSSSFDNAAWNTANATVTANAATSPSGIQDADTLSVTSINENYLRGAGFSILGNVGSAYTTTIYVKKGTANFLRIRNLFVQDGGDFGNAWFNITNGTVATVQSSQTAKIEDAGNGWYRCSLTGVVGSSNKYDYVDFGLTDADNTLFPSTAVNSYIWGAQLEAGSYPTSYIPTTSASLTRNADVISKTGISSLIGQTEGTLFLDVTAQLNNADEQDISISDGTGNNRAIIRLTSSGVIRGIGVFGGNLEFNIGGSAYATGTRYKIALAYKNNDVALYVNGTLQGSTSTTTISGTLSRLGFDVFTNGAQIICSPTHATALWKTRLTNTQLAQLTTI